MGIISVEQANSYEEFCDSVDIPKIYTSKEDFRKRYPFDSGSRTGRLVCDEFSGGAGTYQIQQSRYL